MPETSDHAIAVPKGCAVARMYCTGLGDCFLLGFPDANGDTAFMMIDCGVLQGTAEAKPRMQRIMKSIVDTTGERGVEVLVVTHKHWDHLSGFDQAGDEFARLEVKQVWMGWTESPTDPGAVRLAAQEESALRAIRAAVLQLRGIDAELAGGLQELLGFDFGLDGDVLLGARTSTNDLLELVRARDDNPVYLEPSLSPRSLAGVPGVNIYVLGPPTDLALLRKSDPSSGEASEVYLDSGTSDELGALYAAAELGRGSAPLAPEERAMLEFSYPFDPGYGLTQRGLQKDPELAGFFDKYYKREAWRRIDNTWLRGVEQLALNFNNYRNNTSVAMAIELGEGGPVMIFPGDAQVGNWLSWHKLEGSPSAQDLLGRAVLYKVGHHASHNATLKRKGLAMMTRTSRLVAMIPVDEEHARKPKGRNPGGWDMPYGELLQELEECTEGRVMRADLGVPLLDRRRRPAGWSAEKWVQFKANTRVVRDPDAKRPFFIDYTVQP